MLFAVLLVFTGVLLYLFWAGSVRNLLPVAAAFDAKLTDILVAQGVNDGMIAAQYQKERKEGTTAWVEYHKKIKLPRSIDYAVLQAAVEKLAKSSGLDPRSSRAKDGEAVIEMTLEGRRIYELVLVPAPAPSKKGPVAAIVIDDVGNKNNLSPFLDLGIPITFAILPFEKHTKDSALALTEKGMPYILHLPLEPEGFPKVNPGKAALLVGMTDEEIKKKFAAGVGDVPGISGISNHMGSRYSADEKKMSLLLTLVKEKNLFYFDSYTTQKSKARAAAKNVVLPFLENRLFLDVEDNPEFMNKQLELFLKRAQRSGSSIAIGHIHKKYLAQCIKEFLPRFKEAGVEFVYLTDLLE